MRTPDSTNSNQDHYRAKTTKQDRFGNTTQYKLFNPRASKIGNNIEEKGNPSK